MSENNILFPKQSRVNWTFSNHIVILFLIFLLCIFGLLMVYSSSGFYAQREIGNIYYFLIRHTVYLGVGLVGMLFFIFILPYQKLTTYSKFVFLFSIFLLALVLTPLGTEALGSKRWLRFAGLSFQPVELVKISLIIWLADFLDRKKDFNDKFSQVLFLPLLYLGGIVLLLLFQPDFGTAVLISLTSILIIMVAGVNFWHLFIVGSAGAFYLISQLTEETYRQRRLMAYLDPWSDYSGAGYQLINSMIAYGNGGFFGTGLGSSIQKQNFLPQAHNDFISSVIAEEIGYFWFLVMLAVFLGFFWFGYKIAKEAKDNFGRLLAFGLVTSIALQSLVHIGVTMGLLPTKGLGLPFVSYGGTALIFHMSAVGILVSISRGSAVQK